MTPDRPVRARCRDAKPVIARSSSVHALFVRLKSCVLVAAVMAAGDPRCRHRDACPSAQFGAQAGFADAFRPEFLDRDMPLFVEILKLEDWQRPIVEVLVAGLHGVLRSGRGGGEGSRCVASRAGSATPGRTRSWRLILEPLDGLGCRAGRARSRTFLRNVRAQLTGAQIDPAGLDSNARSVGRRNCPRAN